MLHFLTNLPWPAAGEWFGAVVIFLGLYPLRLIIKAVLPEDRLARNLIIKMHVRNNHTSPLKLCHTGYCAHLSPSNGTGEQAAASILAEMHH